MTASDSIRLLAPDDAVDPDIQRLFHLFDACGIAHQTWCHPPIFTVEEGVALDLPGLIPGQHGKSLLLTNQNGELWLVIACEETRVNLKALAGQLGVKRFSFASPQLLKEVLDVTPGSVTPFAVINDATKKVKVVIHDQFHPTTHCVFHPLRNTHSTRISVPDLYVFLRHLGYAPLTLPLA